MAPHLAPPPDFRGGFQAAPEPDTEYAGARGPFHIAPAAVARPASADDVVRLAGWARAEGAALVPRGGATGMPGHNVGPGVVVDLTALDAVDPVDRERRTVRVGPGAVAAELADAAEAADLYFPPLPSSARWATLGGMAANNAAGARSFLHGAVRDWIVEIDVVLPDGHLVTLGPGRPLPDSLASLRRELGSLLVDGAAPGDPPIAGWPGVRKNSSGYALDRFLPSGDGAQLLAGSEGTLGLVTSVTVRLIGAPDGRGVLLLGVPEIDLVPEIAHRAEAAGASACEYFGRRILEMAGLEDDPEVGPLARGADALVLLEAEGDEDRVARSMEAFRTLAADVGGGSVDARDEEARERLWEVRHQASPTIEKAAERGLHSTQFIEDCVVPRDRLPDYVRGLKQILADADTDAVVFGHAGDGNLHVNPLVDRTRPGWRGTVREILERTVDLVAGLGGTMSGEHGDGRVRAPFLEDVWGPGLTRAFEQVKRTVDPENRMNPGVVIPLPGQDPLEGLSG